MGAMFRSEQMALCQLFIQPEAAYLSVSELGETGTVQFRDLNGDVNYFQRKFVNEVRRCDEMERKLRYIEAEVRKDGVPIVDNLTELPRAPNPRMIIDLEAHLEETENDILELSQNAVNLKSNYLELTELRHVLEKTQVFFTEEEANDSITRTLINEEPQNPNTTIRGRLEFVAGVINRERVPAFERMLWRISRGNVFLRQAELDKPLEDPATGNQIFKTVFVAFFQGEQLKSRIRKVCTGFHASLYPCPHSHAERQEMVKGVRTRLEDLNLVLNQTHDHRQRVLHNVAKELPNWAIMVRKMKAIYHTMNLFNVDVTKKCLIGECWVPVSDLTIVRDCLNEGSRLCGSSIPSFLNVIYTNENPPTFMADPNNEAASSSSVSEQAPTATPIRDDLEKIEDFLEPDKKRRKVSRNDGKTEQKLEHRLGGILCCAVCLDLPKAAVYQCTNGHLMCAGCFTHVLADARLRDEMATCPNCRIEISRTSPSRNLAVEKAVSELPAECQYCAKEFPRNSLERHEETMCEERISSCKYSRIGCPWRGPNHERPEHEAHCVHPHRSGLDVMEALRDIDARTLEERRLYDNVFDLLSYEKITFNDLQMKPYRTDEFVHKLFYETSRFTAFNNQWVVKARINNSQRDPTQSSERDMTYQLILKTKTTYPLPLHYLILKGPFGDMKVQPRIHKFEFTDQENESPYLPLPLPDTAECNRLLAARAISFRLIMFLASK